MNFLKKNITLVLGLAIPVVMIIAIACTIYLPSLFYKPTTNFLFTLGGGYDQCMQYTVVGNHVASTSPSNPDVCKSAQAISQQVFYVYDVVNRTTSMIAPETAMALTLDANLESKDGYSVGGAGGGGDFAFFFGGGMRDYNSKFLMGHGYSTKLNIPQGASYYSNQFTFLGWIQ